MLTKMTAREARDNFTDLLGLVYYGKKPVFVEKKGRVFAVVVNPDEYQTLKKTAKNRFFALVDETQGKNRQKNAARAIKEITSVTEQVRRQRYAENKQT